MRTSNRFKWRSALGVTTAGVLVCTMTVLAAPQQKNYSIEQVNIPAEIAVVHNVGGGGAAAIPAAPSGPIETYIFKNDYWSGYGVFWNYEPATGLLYPGYLIADEMIMGNGFDPAYHQLSGYGAYLYRSSADPTNGAQLANYHMELWDGDPFGWIDTIGSGGYSGTKIAGSDADFTGVPGPGAYYLKATLSTPISLPNKRVWLVISGDQTCRTGWIISFMQPEIGTIFTGYDDVFLDQTDYDGMWYGSGVCCELGDACVWGTSTQCTGDISGGGYPQGFCSDGDAESPGAWFFAYPPTGCVTGAPSYFDSCASFYANAYAMTDAIIGLWPEGNDKDGNLDTDVSIVGNEMIMKKPGRNVWLEVSGEGWGPGPMICHGGTNDGLVCTTYGTSGDCPNGLCGRHLKSYGADIDSSGYYSGLQGSLTPYRPSCVSDGDCVTALGTGSACQADSLCSAGFADTLASDYLLPLMIAFPTGAVDISTLDYRYGYTIGAAGKACPDPGVPQYGGDLVLTVPGDARGTFTVGYFLSSVLVDQDNLKVPLLGLSPAKITVTVGQCCHDVGTPSLGCVDGVTSNECDATGNPPRVFNPGGTCGAPPLYGCDQCLVPGDCADGDACTVDICDTSGPVNLCANNAVTVTSAQCCDPTCTTGDAADLGGLGAVVSNSDGQVCTDDLCNPGSGCAVTTQCGVPSNPANTDPCDDGNLCTHHDVCDGIGTTDVAACAGLDVNLLTCTPDGAASAMCLAKSGVAHDCVAGNCFCTLSPDLEFVIHPSAKPNGMCFEKDEKITVDVHLGGAAAIINGAQFMVLYDPLCVKFNSIGPAAGTPYTYPIYEDVDEAAGVIFYAIGVDPFGGVGVNGNVNLATISFLKVGNTCVNCILEWGGLNPLNTYLVDDQGWQVGVTPIPSVEIHENDWMTTWVPASQTVNSDCDGPIADVFWASPWGTSSCEYDTCLPAKGKCYDVDIVCVGTHTTTGDMTWAALTGGQHMQGVTTYSCCFTSTICGDSITKGWTVTVDDQQTIDVTVQLEPTIVAPTLTRCIKFELFSDSLTPPLIVEQDIVFGGATGWIGHSADLLKTGSGNKGLFTCITARDQLHSLRSCDLLECVDGIYEAQFVGDPFFGYDNHWLVGGNLDGFKKGDIYASHDVIDILDFGQFVAMYNTTPPIDTPCPTGLGHGDINADGVVDSLDFGFISKNFLEHSKDCCPPSIATLGTTTPRTEVSVRELRQMGMSDLAVADMNNDGLINMEDMALFQSGVEPTKKATRGAKGAGLR